MAAGGICDTQFEFAMRLILWYLAGNIKQSGSIVVLLRLQELIVVSGTFVGTVCTRCDHYIVEVRPSIGQRLSQSIYTESGSQHLIF